MHRKPVQRKRGQIYPGRRPRAVCNGALRWRDQLLPCGRPNLVRSCLPEFPKYYGHSLFFIHLRMELVGHPSGVGRRRPDFCHCCQRTEIPSCPLVGGMVPPRIFVPSFILGQLGKSLHPPCRLTQRLHLRRQGLLEVMMRLQDSLSILVEIGTADPVFHLPNHRNIARHWVAEVQIQNNPQT